MSRAAVAQIGPVQKGIPLPVLTHFKGKYPWRTMSVGDSFFVKGVTTHRLGNAARTWVTYQDNGWKFSVRKDGQGARVWRIK